MITDQQIIDIFEPHKPIIRKWYDDALIKLGQVKDIMGVEVYKRLTADVINNYVLEMAKAYFDNIKEIAEITIDDKYKSLIIFFRKESTATRFKKLNKNTLLSVSNETDRFRAILKGAVIQGSLFPDIQPKVGIEIGHIFNTAGTSYERILLVKKIDDKVSIPLFEINPIDEPQTTVLPAQEIILDLENEQQLKVKKTEK